MSREPYLSSPLSDANALQCFTLSQETYRSLPPFFPSGDKTVSHFDFGLGDDEDVSKGACGHRDPGTNLAPHGLDVNRIAVGSLS